MTEITDFLNNDIKALRTTDSVADAQDLFAEYPFSHFPVLEEGVYIGSAGAEDIELMEEIYDLINVIKESPLKPNEWEAQNIAFEIMNEHYERFEKESEEGNEEATEWLESFTMLAEKLNLVI